MKTSSVQDQVYSSIIDTINKVRLNDELQKVDLQNERFSVAMGHVREVRDFIGTPEKILGSNLTKHGEIAEHVEVGIRNAKSVLVGESPKATFDGVGRTAPEDYRIDGILVQSKFVNGLSNNLDSILDHMGKYENFKNDGTLYHIPKDHYEKIIKIYNGENIEGLSQKSLNAIHLKIEKIELETGRQFSDVVQPGISNYAEVQQGKINQTLDQYERDIEDKNEKLKKFIKEDHEASISEGLKAATAAAAVGGTISLCSSLYYKYQNEGKNIFNGDLTKEDWQEIGLNTAKDSVIAGVTGIAVYSLTNCAGLAAPFAGAFVTAVKGVGSLVNDYRQGSLTHDELLVDSIFICTDSAVVCLATMLGQTLIPIPILGGIIGAIAGRFASKIIQGEDDNLAKKLEESMQDFLKSLDQDYKKVVNKVNCEFDKIENLRKKAFDLKTNISLVESSIELARNYGVSENKILKNEKDLKYYLFD